MPEPRRGRRLVQQGGIVVDEKKVESIDESIPQEKFSGEGVIIRKGKKVFHKAVYQENTKQKKAEIV